jgi:cobalt transporter subunit CbtA
MLSRILAIGVAAGIAAGLVGATVQIVWTVPLIEAAEIYEEQASTPEMPGAAGHEHGAAAPGHGHAAAHDHDGEAWGPAGGFERTFWTVMSNVLAGVGGGLILAALFAVRRDAGVKAGLFAGAGAFLAFSLMPALGLPPELPGTAAAGLYERQAWWFGTALATSAGLGLLFWKPLGAFRLAGLVVIAVPHLIGAPHPEIHEALAPPELAAKFIVTALLASAAFWILLGAATGYLSARVPRRGAAPA